MSRSGVQIDGSLLEVQYQKYTTESVNALTSVVVNFSYCHVDKPRVRPGRQTQTGRDLEDCFQE